MKLSRTIGAWSVFQIVKDRSALRYVRSAGSPRARSWGVFFGDYHLYKTGGGMVKTGTGRHSTLRAYFAWRQSR